MNSTNPVPDGTVRTEADGVRQVHRFAGAGPSRAVRCGCSGVHSRHPRTPTDGHHSTLLHARFAETAGAVRGRDGFVVRRTREFTDAESHRCFVDGVLPAYLAARRGKSGWGGALDLQVPGGSGQLTVDSRVLEGLGATTGTPARMRDRAHDFIHSACNVYGGATVLSCFRPRGRAKSGHLGHVPVPDARAGAVPLCVSAGRSARGRVEERTAARRRPYRSAWPSRPRSEPTPTS